MDDRELVRKMIRAFDDEEEATEEACMLAALRVARPMVLEEAAQVCDASVRDCFCATEPDKPPCQGCLEATRNAVRIRGLAGRALAATPPSAAQPAPPTVCGTCKGKRKVDIVGCHGFGAKPKYRPCPECHGTGTSSGADRG